MKDLELERKLNIKLNKFKVMREKYMREEKTGMLSKWGLKQLGYYDGCVTTLEHLMDELNMDIDGEG